MDISFILISLISLFIFSFLAYIIIERVTRKEDKAALTLPPATTTDHKIPSKITSLAQDIGSVVLEQCLSLGIPKEELPRMLNLGKVLAGSGIKFYTMEEVCNEISNFFFPVKEIYFVVSNIQDIEDPYLSMIKTLLLEKNPKVYYLTAINDEGARRRVALLRDRLRKDSTFENFKARIQNIKVKKDIIEAAFTHNFCFVNPPTANNKSKGEFVAYGTLRDMEGKSSLAYKLPDSEAVENWKRISLSIRRASVIKKAVLRQQSKVG